MVVTLLAGVVISAAAFKFIRGWELSRIENSFRPLVFDRTELFQDKVNDHIEKLKSLAAFFDASKEVEPAEFTRFVGVILSDYQVPIVFGWLPRVNDAERDAFEQAARRDLGVPFQITQKDPRGDMVRATQRSEYFPMRYIEPFTANISLLGFDALSDPDRRNAMERARDTGLPAATKRIQLINRPSSEYYCRVFSPIYSKGLPVSTVEERRKAIDGFVSVIFGIGSTFETTQKNLIPKGIDTFIYDGSAPKNEQFLYYHPSRLYPGRQNSPDSPCVIPMSSQWSESLDVAGRQWRIVSRICPEEYARQRLWQSWFALIIGLLLTSLITFYFIEAAGRVVRVQMLVDERTSALRYANSALEAQIAERMKIEGMLSAERERLEVTLHSIGDGVIATDTSGAITLINAAAAALTGWSAGEAAGRPSQEIFHIVREGTRERCADPVQQVLKSGQIVGLANNTVLIARDGTERVIADSAAPIRDTRGAIIGVVLVFRDVTEIRNTQQALKKSEIRHKTLYDSSADAIMITSIEKGFLAGNSATIKMFRCKDEKEFVAQTPATLSPEYQPDGAPSPARSRQMMAIAMEKGSHLFEWTHRRVDGSEFAATILLTRMEIGGEKLLQATVRDISDRKEAENSLAWEAGVNASIAELSKALITSPTIDDISALILDQAQRLTGSEFGFVGYVDPKSGNFIVPTLTRGMWEKCEVHDKKFIFSTRRGLWGWVLENQKPIMTNAPSADPRSTGTPEGHVPIKRFLGAPAILKGAIVGQV
ncbi:MAG: CHASE domain-containing protein, partial [Candidatus Aureabacteria bacterium]|nr:CHASE domain-containing protein [Candidatus Auribacterota bacterium]